MLLFFFQGALELKSLGDCFFCGGDYKWFIVQLCLSLSNGIKYNLDEK